MSGVFWFEPLGVRWWWCHLLKWGGGEQVGWWWLGELKVLFQVSGGDAE